MEEELVEVLNSLMRANERDLLEVLRAYRNKRACIAEWYNCHGAGMIESVLTRTPKRFYSHWIYWAVAIIWLY